MPKLSAGILLYRRKGNALEIFLVHPGGPFWARKDDGAWSIPKGEYVEGEPPFAAAKREFFEETGSSIDGDFVALGEFRQPSGKLITAFAVQGDIDPASVKSNTFSMEWPRKSGRMIEVPEVDRAAWFSPGEAAVKILKGQRPILDAFAART
jgi:predicted NUDIX family NTP pyrophosphohydrolase